MRIDDTYTGPIDRAVLGGKAAVLLELRRAGFPVPEFVVLTANLFEGIDPADGAALKMHADDLLHDILAGLHTEGPFAVRSSAAVEDSSEKSFAGQFETVLNVDSNNIAGAVVRVLQSAAASRVSSYGGVDAQTGGMAVIIQEMVPATISGVAFGAHPVSGEDIIVINATAGVGEALVSGEITGEEYTLAKDGSVIAGPEAGVLNAAHIQKIAACLARLQEHFGAPQDTEFAFVGEEFFLLQSRPITTIRGERTVWDNSNIVESYPGLTSPLTFSFIEKMYAAVYRQFSLVLGVSPRRVREAETVYNSMLGLLNGRVFYNLNSWYRALAQLPGYSLNAAFMEKMMGVKNKPDFDLKLKRESSLSSWLQVARASWAIFRNLQGARQGKRRFEDVFNRVYTSFSTKDYSAATLREILADYHRFETLMVQDWKAPLVNDFFAMIFFGLLQKQCEKLAPDDPTLHNRLLSASGDVATTAPLERLPRLAKIFASNPALLEAMENLPAAEAWKTLQESPFSHERIEFEKYVADWGHRVAEELKLETVSYADDPVRLTDVLQEYIKNGIDSSAATSSADRIEAEAKIGRLLAGHPVKKRLFHYILGQARYFVSNRENLRYYRTRGFAVVRRMMLAIGGNLHYAGLLDAPRDVFFLQLTEIEKAAGNPALPADFKDTVASRKASYARFEADNLPERIVSWGSPVEVIAARGQRKRVANTSDLFQGIPCSPGVVRAAVRKIVSTQGNTGMSPGILTTYATDPGYVVFFPSAAGILTERGSLLSHAAIVSREMNIPCIVGIEGIMDAVRNGDVVEMDGSTGIVRIIDRAKA